MITLDAPSLETLTKLVPDVAIVLISAFSYYFQGKNFKETIKEINDAHSAQLIAINKAHKEALESITEKHNQEMAFVHQEMGNAHKEKSVAFLTREKEFTDILIQERKASDEKVFKVLDEVKNTNVVLRDQKNSIDKLVNLGERLIARYITAK